MNPQQRSESGEFELGVLLGRRQAFNVMAGKATVADVELLRQIRDSRAFKSKSPSFDHFCADYVGASRTYVNRMISCLDKYGPKFFALTQLTRVSPAVYEAIEPHLTEEGLTLDGETFALSTENAEKVAAAVVELRKRVAAAKPPTEPKAPFDVLNARLQDVIARVSELRSTIESPQRIELYRMLAQLNVAAGFRPAA